jgi:hypothetical protein
LNCPPVKIMIYSFDVVSSTYLNALNVNAFANFP